MAVTVTTYGIGKPGGVAATMGYGFGAPTFVPKLPGRACVLIGTDPSAKRLLGTNPAARKLIGTDPSAKRLVGPTECN